MWIELEVKTKSTFGVEAERSWGEGGANLGNKWRAAVVWKYGKIGVKVKCEF
jgi:hypothetical protein